MSVTKVLCIVLVCVVALDAYKSRNNNDNLIVNTKLGALRGSIIKSLRGKDIYSFRGVRFAKPPIGNLRFQPPAPLDHWEGIQNATEDGAACLQVVENAGFSTSEDCLFLNVYTTRLPSKHHNPKRPVVVFFHPGGFFFFSGQSTLLGPQYFMDQDVVLVTTNYRLAAFGFLSTGDDVLPGNYGMKDQVATLRWVKDNIEAFGGDPASVTIWGYSAGSMSVLLHMLSPMSKGLFHRGIAMSAAPFGREFKLKDLLPIAKKQAELLNCPSGTSKQIKDCLMTKGGQEIASTYLQFFEWGSQPMSIYRPTVEPPSEGEVFLSENPLKEYLSGNFENIPLITGMTKDEFAWIGRNTILNSTLREDLQNDFNRVAPIAFMYERDTEKSNLISKELRRFYFQDKPITNDSIPGIGKLFSDSIIGYPEDIAVKVISKFTKAPLYYYRFSTPGRYTYGHSENGIPSGVYHHDEMVYFFYNSLDFPYLKLEDPEIRTLDRLSTMWVNFIKTGDPIPQKTRLLDNVNWKVFTHAHQEYLDIGPQLEMKTKLYQNRMALWERLFPISEGKMML